MQNAVVTQQYDPTRPGVRQTPAYSHPIARPPPRPPDLADRRGYRTDIGTDPNLDFEENSPHQEGIIAEMYESPDKSYIEEPQKLADLVNKYFKISTEVFSKTNSYRQNPRCNQEKSVKRHTFATYN